MGKVTAEIPDFPFYTISEDGQVWNVRFGHPQQRSLTAHGDLKVTLTNYYTRMTFSVRVLVAEAFVEPPDDLSDTVIIKNNDRADLRSENLAWRPRWFAWQYSRQFKKDQPDYYHNVPIINTRTGAKYTCIVNCAVSEGLLFDDIWRSANLGDRIYPSGDTYAIDL